MFQHTEIIRKEGHFPFLNLWNGKEEKSNMTDEANLQSLRRFLEETLLLSPIDLQDSPNLSEANRKLAISIERFGNMVP